MNFFEHQDQARRNTTKLLLLFSLSIGVMIAAFYGVAVVLVTNTTPRAIAVAARFATAGHGGHAGPHDRGQRH